MTARDGVDMARPAVLRDVISNVTAGLTAAVRPVRAGERMASLAASRRRLALAAVVTVAPVGAAMLWIDRPLNRAVASLPQVVIETFNEITDFGRSAWILVPLAALLFATALAWSSRLSFMARGVLAMLAVRFGFLFLAVGVPGLVGTIVKRIIGRVRPSELGPFAYQPLAWRPEYASLPSGHTITAFAALVAFGILYPRLRPVFWIYALAIGASRVIVSAHFPSDVIAGAVFGACGAILVRDWFAARRLGFYIGADGAVRPMPGPSWARIKRVARAVRGQ